MTTKQSIQKFTESGLNQLNIGQRLRSGIWALLVFGVVALLVELVFVLRGYRVPVPILLLPFFSALAVALVSYFRFRYTHQGAVGHIDQVFDLKDGLVTADEHIREGRAEAMHTLQLQHTERELQQHDPVNLRPEFPRRVLSLSSVLLVASLGLLFIDDSLAVKQAKEEAADTMALSAELVEELEQEFEKVLEDADEKTSELLKDPVLKEMIESLEADKDRLAVMRKLSEIDSRMSTLQSELDTRADENYLQELGEQLRQSKETAALGEALSKRDYGKAAQDLEKMQLGEKPSAAQRKSLEKLAARIGETEKSMSSSKSGSRRSAQELSEQIKKMSAEQQKSGQCSSSCKECLNDSLNKNGNSMRKVGARKKAGEALEKLRQKLQSCQSCMGSGQKPGQGIGEGTDPSRRPPSEQSPATGVFEQLSGQLGSGESERVVEHAESGSGSASGVEYGKASVEYQQQVEAFVRREDIPEEMKHGVKTYFNQIHTIDTLQNEGVE